MKGLSNHISRNRPCRQARFRFLAAQSAAMQTDNRYSDDTVQPGHERESQLPSARSEWEDIDSPFMDLDDGMHIHYHMTVTLPTLSQLERMTQRHVPRSIK